MDSELNIQALIFVSLYVLFFLGAVIHFVLTFGAKQNGQKNNLYLLES